MLFMIQLLSQPGTKKVKKTKTSWRGKLSGGFLGYQSLDGRRKKKRGTICRSDDD